MSIRPDLSSGRAAATGAAVAAAALTAALLTSCGTARTDSQHPSDHPVVPAGARAGSAAGSVDSAVSGSLGIPGSTATLSLAGGGGAAAADVSGPGTAPLHQVSSSPAAGPHGHGAVVRTVLGHRFSLLGVTWNDPRATLPDAVQVQTRDRATGRWSGWSALQTSDDTAPDAGSAEADAPGLRGGGAPMWVGDSDGVRVRVLPARHGGRAVVPAGLRLDLVDPGGQPTASGPGSSSSSGGSGGARGSGGSGGGGGSAEAVTVARTSALAAGPMTGRLTGGAPEGVAERAPGHVVSDPTAPAPDPVRSGTAPTPVPSPTPTPTPPPSPTPSPTPPPAGAPIGQAGGGLKPAIVLRAGWGADEKLRESTFAYTGPVKAVFVHHTDTGNNYTCAQAPAVIRSIYRYHVVSRHWRDIGYNFLVDKCGTIYEGRAGGVDRSVLGAHTLGFNTDSTGVAAIGTYSTTAVPAAVVTAIARLAAWKLSLTRTSPESKVTLLSGDSGSRFKKGTAVTLWAISGHRDVVSTECPGDRMYAELPTIRSRALAFQRAAASGR